MDFPKDCLLGIVPPEILEEVTNETGYKLCDNPFTEEELRWLLGVRRTLAIMYTNDVICNVEYYSIAPEGRMGFENYSDLIDMNTYLMCWIEEDKIFHHLDGPTKTTTDQIISCLVNPSSYSIGYDDNNDVVIATRSLLDLRSVFKIYERRLREKGYARSREIARKRLSLLLGEMEMIYREKPYLYEMYLSTNIINLELGNVKYEHADEETILKKCQEYRSLLEEEIQHMR